MSNDKTEAIPTVPTVPTRRSILRAPAPSPAVQPERGPFADWRGQARTEELLAVPASRRHTGARRHLRAALSGIALAAALLTGMQLYAAAGISSARQAALAERATQTDRAATTQTEQSAPAPAPAPQTGQTGPAPQAEQWAVEGTTTAAPSPLDLPRCTTSPDTPLPCLATISPDSKRAVVLEEDASLTALTRQ